MVMSIGIKSMKVRDTGASRSSVQTRTLYRVRSTFKVPAAGVQKKVMQVAQGGEDASMKISSFAIFPG